MARSGLLLGFVLLPVLGFGCGPKSEPDPSADLERNELIDIFETYSEYLKSNSRPPQRLPDLKGAEVTHSLAMRVIREGKYVVVWGVTGAQPDAILAYPKDAPTQGGSVLLADGTIRTMSAAEVQAVAKGKT